MSDVIQRPTADREKAIVIRLGPVGAGGLRGGEEIHIEIGARIAEIAKGQSIEALLDVIGRALCEKLNVAVEHPEVLKAEIRAEVIKNLIALNVDAGEAEMFANTRLIFDG